MKELFEVDGIVYVHPHTGPQVHSVECARQLFEIIDDHRYSENFPFCKTGIFVGNAS